jgi:transposase
MEEITKTGQVGLAAMKAGMDRKTARKYIREEQLPSEMKRPRDWRTRTDPFADDWARVESMLEDAPELEAKALFEHLAGERPGLYHEGQLRTFQRRLRRWRAQSGPPKDVFFAQEHRPGEAAQVDFTVANELDVTIGGEPFTHMLCHVVLPYSNWQWATVCFTESLAALKSGTQSALFRLGRIPEWYQSDNSTAATHNLGGGKRDFNREYKEFIEYLGMKPRTTAVGQKEQNGDVEAANGALKRRLKQHLLLRGSRDFESRETYQHWVQEVLVKANALREAKVAEELERMRPLSVRRLPEWREERVTVTSWSTIRVKKNTYSVPSRLMNEEVKVRVWDDRLEVYYADIRELVVERLHGRGGHRINYRHIIWSLVRKPAAFRRYKYREDLFPQPSFRRAYDMLCGTLDDRRADIEYLRILHLAASTMEADVETALQLLEAEQLLPLSDKVKELVVVGARPAVPEVSVPVVDLTGYDEHLEELGREAS